MYTHLMGIWFIPDAPVSSHLALLQRLHPTAHIAFAIALTYLYKRQTWTSLYVTFAFYASITSTVVTAPPIEVVRAINPIVQLALLLVCLPTIFAIPAAFIGVMTDVVLFKIVGIAFIALKILKWVLNWVRRHRR